MYFQESAVTLYMQSSAFMSGGAYQAQFPKYSLKAVSQHNLKYITTIEFVYIRKRRGLACACRVFHYRISLFPSLSSFWI